ncbi:thioesterase II family protein [Nocardia sp. NPDC058497]|uniref:thioesterase II family protein n=1 Tax=Nocardia sp. NPDC058497 TaxID=3346529 RepID=UPI003650CA2E
MDDREHSLWIKRFDPAPSAGVRLACLPHAGGAASYFLPVSRALAGDCEVLAVQYPGRQERRHEPHIGDVAELAHRIAEELLAWTDRPLALFGHSMGSTVGFEVARVLEAKGCAPVALLASGRRAPSRPRVEAVHRLPDAGLVDALTSMQGTSADLLADPEILELILPTIRADYRAIESYRYEPGAPLSAPIHAFLGDNDPQVTVDEAEAWREHTTADFGLHLYRGGHFYLNTHAAAVIAEIRDILALPAR